VSRDVDVSDAGSEEEEERILRNAWPPVSHFFFDWLKTPDGSEIAKQGARLLESLKKETLGRQFRLNLIDAVARYLLVAGILLAAVYLRVIDKLDTVMVGLLSGALGFLLGRQAPRK
jgi:hypothetical protein